MGMNIMKAFIKNLSVSILTILLIIAEFIFIITLGSDFYNLIYNYSVFKTVTLIMYALFPFATISLINILCKNLKQKLINNICLSCALVVLTAIYNIKTVDNDVNFNGFFLIMYCIWILVCCFVLSILYFRKARK